MEALAARFRAVAAKIPAGVTLVAVSKTQPAEAIEALYHLGHRDFGENYAQELVEKARQLEARGCTGIRWHFIGHLQTNKVKALLPFVECVQSVDSLRLAQEISKRAVGDRPAKVFIEVNQDAEATKSGAIPAETPRLAKEIAALHGLDLQGLMSIPAPAPESVMRAKFRELRELELKCRPATQGKLSMGMSADFEAAIAEGATHVRVGTQIFGPRKA